MPAELSEVAYLATRASPPAAIVPTVLSLTQTRVRRHANAIMSVAMMREMDRERLEVIVSCGFNSAPRATRSLREERQLAAMSDELCSMKPFVNS
jgi:hypothetical protein